MAQANHLNPTLLASTLFQAYQTSDGRFDECKHENGRVRQAWTEVAHYLTSLGTSGLDDRYEAINHLIRENGTTLNLPDEKLGLDQLSTDAFGTLSDDATRSSGAGQINGSRNETRPWQLSPIPMVINSASWRPLQEGLKQRVRLLEAILQDLLGPQRLVKEKVIPASVLWSNPLYHRAYQTLPDMPGRRLHLTATDLARAPDGSWWVTGDRTRAPSGLGYLLENRITTNRIYPALIRRCNTRRPGFLL